MNCIEEKSILERFKLHYPNFPIGIIHCTDKPDFIVEGDLKLGIEITQIFKDQDSNNGSFLRTMESYKRNLLNDIVFLLKNDNIPRCLVSLAFNSNGLSNKIKPKIIAEKCVEDILEKFCSEEIQNRIRYTIENDGQLPELINSYTLWFDSSLEETAFVETTGGVGSIITNREIQFILDKKEISKKLFQSCDFYWLIIKEGSFGADYFSSIKVNQKELNTTFDKVFLIRQFKTEIVEII